MIDLTYDITYWNLILSFVVIYYGMVIAINENLRFSERYIGAITAITMYYAHFQSTFAVFGK